MARFWLDSDRAGVHAVEVTMVVSCDLTGAAEVPLQGGPIGLRLFVAPTGSHPGTTVRRYVFAGGCVTARFSFTREGSPSLFNEADRFLGFTPRSVYVAGVEEDSGLSLCGTGVPPCPGEATPPSP
jgi:hypothetical protein